MDDEQFSQTFKVTCACGQIITVDVSKIGQKGRCPKCKRKMTILNSTIIPGDDEAFDGPIINDGKAEDAKKK